MLELCNTLVNTVICLNIFYKIHSDSAYFTIDNNGNISKSNQSILSNKGKFIIVVVAKDKGYPSLMSVAVVTVNLLLNNWNY